jgi:hypothetical protein
MKPSTLIATAAALTGFATGWLLKPSGEPAVAGPDAAESSGKRAAPAGGKSRERDDRPLILKARGSGEMAADPERASAQVAFQRGFGSATERAENARLSRLTEALGLSPQQQATMEVLLANRRDGFRDLNGGGLSSSEMVDQAARAEQAFEQQVAKLLDPEQADAFAALREREKENSIESKAQRDLADLIGQIDLSADQREQALEALRGGSAEAIEKLPAGWSLMNESFSKLGGAHAAVLEEMGEFMGDDDAMSNSQEFHRRLVQSKREAMERSLARLAPILTPGQLAQYRSTLEARLTFIEQVPPPNFEKR